MAKSKHSTALFEVINKGKRSARAGSGSPLDTPKWWFKSRDATAASPPASAPASASSQPPQTLASSPAAPMGAALNEMRVDRDRQQISLRLNYTSALIGLFVLLVVLVLAYVIGRHFSRAATPMLTPPSEEIMSGPVSGSALDLSRPAAPANPAPAPAAAGDAPRTWTAPAPPATLLVDDVHRTIGLNYVIVQSYPVEKDAAEARDLLLKEGILCTAEHTPPTYGRGDWYSVIGIKGFDKIRNVPEFEQYVRAIEQASKKFAAGSKFKKFDPQPFRWRETR